MDVERVSLGSQCKDCWAEAEKDNKLAMRRMWRRIPLKITRTFKPPIHPLKTQETGDKIKKYPQADLTDCSKIERGLIPDRWGRHTLGQILLTQAIVRR